MANRIVGLDIGSYAVKAVTIELQRELEVVDYREIHLAQFVIREEEPGGADGTAQGEGVEAGVAEAAAGASAEDEAPQGPGGDWSDEGVDLPLAPIEEMPAQADRREPWIQAIAKLQYEGYFEGTTKVITSFPNGKAVTLHLDVPFERKANVESILPHVLSDELPLSLNKVIYDFIVIPGKGPDMWEALVGFVERRDVGRFLMDIQALGVDPAVLGVPELMYRYLGDQSVDPGVESYGLIDIGHRFTRLLIMSDGRPVVARTVRNGGESITKALAERFGIDFEQAEKVKHERARLGEAFPDQNDANGQIASVVEGALGPIVRDLRRTFQSAYASYQVAVDQIYICGGTSRIEGIEGLLQREFQVPVERLQFGESLLWTTAGEGRERTPEVALALGNALQVPLDRSEERLVNFRKDEFVFRGKSSFLRSQLVRLGAVAAVLAVMLAGVLMMQHADQRAQLRAMQEALAQQTEELFGEAITAPDQVQARLAGEIGPDRSFVPRMSAYELMYRLIEEIGTDVPLELERIEVDMERNLIQVVGTTGSPQAVDRITSDVQRLECLTDVRQGAVQPVGSDGAVRFELEIASGCS